MAPVLTPRLAATVATFAVLATTTSVVSAPSTAAPDAAPTAVRAPALAVTGFALGSLTSRRLARDADVLDTVTVAGVGLRAGGASVTPPSAEMKRVRRAARRQGLATELLVSNYSDRLGDFDPAALHRLLSSPKKFRAVARQVATMADRGGWGGVNVDLELVRPRDAAGLTAFVRAVRAALPDAATVSIDVSAATSVSAYRQHGYQLGALARVVDVVVLMAYDLHGPTWSGPGPVGDLRWQRRAVRAAAQRVPKAKLDLGVAGYGYTWPRRGTGRTITPAGARRLVERDGVRAVWHPAMGEWSVTLDDGTRLWWSDARSYVHRRRLARELGVHGLAVWRLGSADRLR